MLPQEIIAKKRDGEELTPEEVAFFVQGLTNESITEGQVGAMAMAVLLMGMEMPERVALTQAMRDSGTVLEWDLPGPVVDKHSTGGVGDNVSLMLAPALAACGAYVPMISGRGLGHTGGTLDKFDSIPGYRTQPDLELLRKVTSEVGCAIIGQTPDIAPADKRFYGIRDVTGTVESVDLITASILSKKLAAGLDALVLDVKVGTGAFMTSAEDADELAHSLVEVAKGAGCTTSAIITDMNQPLASCAGNALEVENAVGFLTMTDVDARLWDVTVALGGELLALSGLAADYETGCAKMVAAFESGAAAEKFGQMVTALGGPADFLENHGKHLPSAPIVREVLPDSDGLVAGWDAKSVGFAVVELGGGRRRAADPIDYAVGLDMIAEIGTRVDQEMPIARIHANSEDEADQAERRLRSALRLSDEALSPTLLKQRIV
ncbi:MAG: thymidine phosphorylase [Pseudomonadota bacterium]